MTDGRRPVQTGFFFLFGHRCWKKEEREGGRERRKSGTEKDAKVRAGQRQPESVFVAGAEPWSTTSIFGSCCFN